MNVIKPTFKFLANPELLKKCTHGKTQNPNESFNNLIWKRCPKTRFASSTIVKIASFDAALVFNCGNISRLRVLERLGFSSGAYTLKILKTIDDNRIAASENSSSIMEKEARQRNQVKRKAVQEAEQDDEYG